MSAIRKHPVPVILAVCAVIIILGALWYTRPMTLEQLGPGVKLEECRGISGYYTSALETSGPQEFTLSAEDPAFASLLEHFQSRTFRRSLLGLLPQRTRTHIGWGVTWDVYFEFEDVTFSNGNIHSGTLLHVNNFYGTVDISFAFADKWRQVSTTEKDQWLTTVFKIISAEDG